MERVVMTLTNTKSAYKNGVEVDISKVVYVSKIGMFLVVKSIPYKVC